MFIGLIHFNEKLTGNEAVSIMNNTKVNGEY